MAEDPKSTPKDFQSFCGGMPFGDMMKKMMEAKQSGQPFNCAGIMSQMMQMCCGGGKKEEEPSSKTDQG